MKSFSLDESGEHFHQGHHRHHSGHHGGSGGMIAGSGGHHGHHHGGSGHHIGGSQYGHHRLGHHRSSNPAVLTNSSGTLSGSAHNSQASSYSQCKLIKYEKMNALPFRQIG